MSRSIRRVRRGAAVLAFGLAVAAPAAAQRTADAPVPALTYTIDLRERADDRFHVRLDVAGLGAENAVYQFASTAPGTYQVMDVGRFVEGFRALDAEGNEIAVEEVSTNQFRIADPARVRTIEYAVAETWDTPVEEHFIYPMAGSSIEADHVLINGNAVFGYPTGLQGAPVRVAVTMPEGWVAGTALLRDAEGAWTAEDYDQLVDSPILLGELTVAETEVGGADVEIYTYSASGGIKSDMLLSSMRAMLGAAGEFLGELPVDRYVFLYHFEGTPKNNYPYGAWEHSYSSEYVFPDVPYSEGFGGVLTDVAAHEFLHIVTPLNIHSEIIESFNFVEPVPSRHLWLYEGVTEWGAHASQMRAGLKTPETYLEDVAQKIANDRANFDQAYSLEKLALTSYGDEGQAQYGNIYQKGAVVAGLLDIRLLEMSNGEAGLQDLLVELMDEYGKEEPFPDDGLFQVIAEKTDPAILDFFTRYVQSAEPLPIAEYYAKLGIDFVDDDSGPRFVIRADPTPEQQRLRARWQAGPPAS